MNGVKDVIQFRRRETGNVYNNNYTFNAVQRSIFQEINIDLENDLLRNVEKEKY